jgi:hypothetical protein
MAFVLLGGCSKDDDDGDAAPTSTTVAAKPAVVTKASDAPRTENYVGARKDVSDLTCTKDGDVWRVSGKVTNPTGTVADYRIFTSLLDKANETRGLLQADVKALAPKDAKPWSSEVALEDADDLQCVLRVERTGVNGAPPPTEPPS